MFIHCCKSNKPMLYDPSPGGPRREPVRTVRYLGLYISMDSLTLTLARFSQGYLAEAEDDVNILLEQIETVT